jgi:RNA polymerase sigma-70 factor (ECF subfamily)
MNRADFFEEIFTAHGDAILAYLVRRVRPAEDAADLMSEVFATAWRRIDDVPRGEAARLWLYKVAHKTLANHRRGRLRRARLADRLRAHLTVHPYGGTEPSPATDAVREALEHLDAADRELLTLAAWEELTSAEIGTVLGLKAATVRARLAKARERLRRALEASRSRAEVS